MKVRDPFVKGKKHPPILLCGGDDDVVLRPRDAFAVNSVGVVAESHQVVSQLHRQILVKLILTAC